MLERWLTKNHKTAHLSTRCWICQEAIAQAILEGRDPFAFPDALREDFKALTLKISRGKPYVRKQADKQPTSFDSRKPLTDQKC